MTPHHIVTVCLRLVALIWLFYTLSHLYSLFAYVNSDPEVATVAWLFALLQVGTCAVLWFFPATIAAKLLPSAADAQDIPVAPRLVEWQSLGVICIGLWGLSRAIPDVAYWFTFYFAGKSFGDEVFDLDAEHVAGIVATVVEVAISTWLIVGAKGLSALLFKIRTGGVAKD